VDHRGYSYGVGFDSIDNSVAIDKPLSEILVLELRHDPADLPKETAGAFS